MDDQRRKQLMEQYDDAILSLLMDEYAECEGRLLLQAYEDAKKGGTLEALPPELDRKCMQLIGETHVKEARQYRLKSILRPLAKAAVVVLVLFALSTVTILSVDAFRVPVINFLIDQSGKYGTVILGSTENYEQTESNSIIDKFHTNIPYGYQIAKQDLQSDSSFIYCTNEDHGILYLEMSKTELGLNVDTEDTNYTELELGEYAAVFQEKNGFYLRWLDHKENILYTLFSNNLSPDEFWELAYTLIQ